MCGILSSWQMSVHKCPQSAGTLQGILHFSRDLFFLLPHSTVTMWWQGNSKLIIAVQTIVSSICWVQGRRISCPQFNIFNGSAWHFQPRISISFLVIGQGTSCRWEQSGWSTSTSTLQTTKLMSKQQVTSCMWPHISIFSTSARQCGEVFQQDVLTLWPHSRTRVTSSMHRSASGLEHVIFWRCPHGRRRSTISSHRKSTSSTDFPGQVYQYEWPQFKMRSVINPQPTSQGFLRHFIHFWCPHSSCLRTNSLHREALRWTRGRLQGTVATWEHGSWNGTSALQGIESGAAKQGTFWMWPQGSSLDTGVEHGTLEQFRTFEQGKRNSCMHESFVTRTRTLQISLWMLLEHFIGALCPHSKRLVTETLQVIVCGTFSLWHTRMQPWPHARGAPQNSPQNGWIGKSFGSLTWSGIKKELLQKREND